MKRWTSLFLAGAAVTAACLLPASPALAQDAAALVAKGRAALQKGDWPGAKEAFLAAVAKDGKNVEARRGAAESLLGLGLHDEAVEQAIAGLDLVQDKDAGLWLLAARGYLRKAETLPAAQTQEIGDSFADAKAKAAEALKRDPDLAMARVVLSTACRLTNEAARAAGVLEEGLAKAPADFDLNFEMGMVQLKNTNYEAALKAFDAAAAADPKSSEARVQRGLTLAFLKRWSEAFDAMVKAAVVDPASRRPLQYLAKWQKEKAIPHYRAILKEKPDHAWAHAYVAYFLAHGKDEAGALAESKAAMGHAPKDADLMAWHGQVLQILGKDDAIDWFRKALATNAGCDLAWNNLFEAVLGPKSTLKMGERQPLIEFMAKARPDDAMLWNNAGLLYRDVAKDYKSALEAYLKAAKLAPSDQGIQNDTGLIYLYHGASIGADPKDGLPYFLRTLALVDDEGQAAEMGFRDTLENLTVYYMTVEKNPEKCLEYAKRRNDPEFLRSLPKGLGAPSPRAEQGRSWAEGELKKK
jgi:tetratricopeptide (TPR) repeat protein